MSCTKHVLDYLCIDKDLIYCISDSSLFFTISQDSVSNPDQHLGKFEWHKLSNISSTLSLENLVQIAQV